MLSPMPGSTERIGATIAPANPASMAPTPNTILKRSPMLTPSADTMALGQAAQASASDKEWAAFRKKYRGEMAGAEASRTLDLLAALSHTSDFSVGCYCENEARCHRSLLRELLGERGAKIAP